MKYLQPSMLSLMEGAAALEQFADLQYVNACLRRMEEGHSFSEAWKKALRDFPGELHADMVQALSELGDTLGASDLESQLTAISYTRELLENGLRAARDYRDKHAKLYRTLGLLCGLAVAVILV